MSTWADVKCNTKCSVSEMLDAIKSVYPEWEKYIQVDESGKAVGRDMHNVISHGHIVVSKKAPGMQMYGMDTCDAVFTRKQDGTWDMKIEKMLSDATDRMNTIQVEAGIKHAQASVEALNADSSSRTGDVLGLDFSYKSFESTFGDSSDSEIKNRIGL